MSVLRVRAHLSSPVASADPVHLDGIALWAHPDCNSHPISRSSPLSDVRYPPISIHRLRVGDLGVYLSSAWILPDGCGGRERFVRRRDDVDAENFSAPYRVSAGPQKRYCLPIYTCEVEAVEWIVVGNRRGLLELLRYVHAIGTHRREGYGVVRRWEAERVEDGRPRDALIDATGRARRFLPSAWTAGGTRDDAGAVVPPYWHPGLRMDRVRPGSACALLPAVEEELSRCH